MPNGFFRRLGRSSWNDQQQERKRQLQSRAQKCEDGRWSTKLLDWTAEGTRMLGRPHKRYAD
eukprot:2812507-Pyramimonas_sp.AAC.1